jgi:hypothetical protein
MRASPMGNRAWYRANPRYDPTFNLLRGRTQLRVLDVLKEKPRGPELVQQLITEIRRNASFQLEHVRDLFPLFTDHSIRHSDGVLEILDWLLPDEIKIHLNEWELYFLVAATYLHDIGMVEGCPGPPSGPDWEDFIGTYQHGTTQADPLTADLPQRAKREFVRAHHHLRSEAHIKAAWQTLGLTVSGTGAEGAIIGRIAAGHRKLDLADQGLFGVTAFGNNQLIRRNLLAAYLRLADELDTTAFRTPWAEHEILDINDIVSASEWAKHMAIHGVSIENDELVLSGTCYDFGTYQRLLRLQSDIRAKLLEIRKAIPRPLETGDGLRIAEPVPYQDVLLRIEHLGYLPVTIGFELQHREIVSLIMGERLYGDKSACLRELLQNAVDTCQEAHQHRPPTWMPSIIVEESEDGTVLAVSDNGMGMDEYIVRTYFARIGISYYRSADFHGDFEPISEFGIGILSCFMLADWLEVDSKREDSEPILLEIRSVADPFVPRHGSRNTPGTTVRLHLKPELVGTLDVTERVGHFARYVDLPIEIRTAHAQVQFGGNRRLAPTLKDVRGAFSEWKEIVPSEWGAGAGQHLVVTDEQYQGLVSRHSVTEVRPGLDVGVTLIGTLLPESPKDRMLSFRPRGLVHLYQDGFYVNAVDIDGISQRGNKFLAWVEANIRGRKRLKLTADRTRLVEGTGAVEAEVLNAYSAAVESLIGAEVAGRKLGWWEAHLGLYEFALKFIPEALLKAASEGCEYCVLTKDGFRRMQPAEIQTWPGQSYAFGGVDHGWLTKLLTRLGQGDLIVVLPGVWPPFTKELKDWPLLLAGDRIESGRKLIEQLGGTVFTADVNDTELRFLDLGSPVSSARMAYDWEFDYSTSRWRGYYDAQHPVAQLMRAECGPRQSGLLGVLLGSLTSRADALEETELENAWRTLVRLLSSAPAEAELLVDYIDKNGMKAYGLAGHNCPYVLPAGADDPA